MLEKLFVALLAMTSSDFVPVLVGGATGGLAGAVLTLFATRRHRRLEMSHRIINDFYTKSRERANVKDILQTETQVDRKVENRIRNLANWFDFIALLYRRYANRQILRRLGINKEVNEFRDLVNGTRIGRIKEISSHWSNLQGFYSWRFLWKKF